MTPEQRQDIAGEIADCRAAITELRGRIASAERIIFPVESRLAVLQDDAKGLIYEGEGAAFTWSRQGLREARPIYAEIDRLRKTVAPTIEEKKDLLHQVRILESESDALKHKLKIADGEDAKTFRRASTDARLKRRKGPDSGQGSLF